MIASVPQGHVILSARPEDISQSTETKLVIYDGAIDLRDQNFLQLSCRLLKKHTFYSSSHF